MTQGPLIVSARSASSSVFLALFGALALAGILTVLLPFIGPVVLAGSLTITAYPVYFWMGRRWPLLSKTFRAFATDLAILMLFVLPVLALIWTAAGQADNLRTVLGHWIQASQAIHEGRLDGSLKVVRPIPDAIARKSGMSRTQAKALLLSHAARGLDRLADGATDAASQLLQSVASLLLCPLITFFLLRDATVYVERMGRFLPLCAEDKERLFNRVRDATVAVVRGLFLTALLEGAIAATGYALMGIHCAVLLGVVTGLASVVPLIGTSSIWVPVGLVTILSGRVMPGALVLLWGMGMVLVVDNFAAPWLVGRRIRMSLLPLLLGMLGGTAVFGLKGLLIGPLIVSIAPTVLEIVQRRVFAPEHIQSTFIEQENCHEYLSIRNH
jgi:predicted PurR-regulated permease PerM